MSKENGKEQPDLLVEGFHKLDGHLLDNQAPKLTLMSGFHDKDNPTQVRYLLRLAATMNHAAKLVSEERDKLVEAIVLKEQQLETLVHKMEENNLMLQSEVTKMNEQKQGFHTEVRRLNTKIRELEGGHKH